MKSLLDLLKGVDARSQERLDQLRQGGPHRFAWYPSAGGDFRDLVEVDRTGAPPDIFIHTDYDLRSISLAEGALMNEYVVPANINAIYQLEFRVRVDYQVNHNYVDFPQNASEVPLVFLLDVEVVSEGRTIQRPVLYFYMENINFLMEVLIRHKVDISHFIKVREGMGMGGNRQSITLAYAFLSWLNVEFLLVDNQPHTDYELMDELMARCPHPQRCTLTELDRIRDWSGFPVKVYSVTVAGDQLNRQHVMEMVALINA
jgi:hypothetical protein